jgi:Uma2 family endonuclease
MRTVVLVPEQVGMSQLLERRRRLGLDVLDEVWDGDLHMVPAPNGAHADISHQLALILDGPARAAALYPWMSIFNLGDSEHDYRVPDGGLLRGRSADVWFPTAAMVVEIVSPGDESWDKLPFYAAHAVDEVLIVDPQKRSVDWLALRDGAYVGIERSGLIDLGAAELHGLLDWPAL